MRQIKVKRNYHAGWGVFVNNTSATAMMDGIGDFAQRALSFGNYNLRTARSVVAESGVLKNLFVTVNDDGAVTHNNLQFVLVKNGVQTALSVSINAGVFSGFNITDEISVDVGDDVSFELIMVNTAPTGVDLGFSLEFNGAQYIYGISTQNGTRAVGYRAYGGAFDNGFWQQVGGSLSNSFSLVAVEGSITRLILKNLAELPVVGGSWKGWIRVDGIRQDGSGGTVNTEVILTDQDDFIYRDFDLPVSLAQKIDFEMERFGQATTAGDLGGPTLGLRFNPDTPGHHMLCGGSNDAIVTSGSSFIWVRSDQNGNAIEERSTALVGTPGFNCLGLYVDRALDAGNLTSGYDYTVRKNGADTDITCQTIFMTRTASDTGNIRFSNGSEITIGLVPFGSAPSQGQFHWGLAVSAVNPNPGSGIYRLRKDKRNDTIWTDIENDVAEDQEIPDPFFKTSLLGD